MVQFFARNGFTVLIDNHLREDSTVLEQPQKWLQVRGHRLAAALAKFGGLLGIAKSLELGPTDVASPSEAACCQQAP